MKIGIDLDGVIFDTEKTFRVYSELYDMLELKQNSKENNYELKLQDRFNWSEEQINDFFNKYCIALSKLALAAERSFIRPLRFLVDQRPAYIPLSRWKAPDRSRP